MKKMKKKNEVKRMNFRVPQGLTFKLTPGDDGRWVWIVKRFATILGSGSVRDPQEAKKEMQAALLAAIESVALSSSKRAELRMKLKYWAQRRSYVVMHVFYRLSEGAANDRDSICDDAATEEVALHAREGKSALPLPTHHLAKDARVLAGEIFDIATRLNLTGRAAYAWASNYFGFAFSKPGESVEALLDGLVAGAKKTKVRQATRDDDGGDFDEDEDDEIEAATPDTAGDE